MKCRNCSEFSFARSKHPPLHIILLDNQSNFSEMQVNVTAHVLAELPQYRTSWLEMKSKVSSKLSRYNFGRLHGVIRETTVTFLVMGIESPVLITLKYCPRVWFSCISTHCAWDISGKMFVAWKLGPDARDTYFILGIFGVSSLPDVSHSQSYTAGSI